MVEYGDPTKAAKRRQGLEIYLCLPFQELNFSETTKTPVLVGNFRLDQSTCLTFLFSQIRLEYV